MRVDLRSDTVTRPSSAMLQAMLQAPVGDDVYGEDPSVAALEQRVAQLFGHDAALFTPTGTMANQLGVRAHVAPGQELIAEQSSHVLRAEMGAAAALSGVTTRSWASPARSGLLEPGAVTELMAPAAGAYQVSTTCVVIENTHNFGGGTVQPVAAMRAVRQVTAQAGVSVHIDGARIWNAMVATGVPAKEYGACADTIAVCLSKGLGAPAGSLLIGGEQTIAEARIWRKRWGGAMRQVGLLAAAGAYAIDHHLAGLADDHDRTRRCAKHIASIRPEVVDPDRVDTNILILDVGAAGWQAAQFVAAAAERGVAGFAVDAGTARYVWHRDVDEAQTAEAMEVLGSLVDPAAAAVSG